MAEALSEDGTKVRIVDSAPGATWERIKKASLYYQKEDGSFQAVQSLDELPGIRYYFETGEYGGMRYWLDLSYCAKRGMRLIRRQWLKLDTEEGPRSVSLQQFGTVESQVVLGEETRSVPTRDLRWQSSGAEETPVAIVAKKGGTPLKDGDGKKISGFKTVPEGTLFSVLLADRKTVYVFYKGVFGHVDRKDVDLLSLPEESFPAGLIALNGKTNGRATVKLRASASAKGRVIAEWKTGTPVFVLEKQKGFCLVEGKGARAWVQDEYLQLEEATTEGQD